MYGGVDSAWPHDLSEDLYSDIKIETTKPLKCGPLHAPTACDTLSDRILHQCLDTNVSGMVACSSCALR